MFLSKLNAHVGGLAHRRTAVGHHNASAGFTVLIADMRKYVN